MADKKNVRIGSSLDDFLRDEGVFEEVETIALKRAIAWQLEQAMQREELSKAEMAERMGTSRAQLDRILDPELGNMTVNSMLRAASATGHAIEVRFVKREVDASAPEKVKPIRRHYSKRVGSNEVRTAAAMAKGTASESRSAVRTPSATMSLQRKKPSSTRRAVRAK